MRDSGLSFAGIDIWYDDTLPEGTVRLVKAPGFRSEPSSLVDRVTRALNTLQAQGQGTEVQARVVIEMVQSANGPRTS